MTYVRETIVTTKNIDGTIKMSPLGIYIDDSQLKIRPFKPSVSLDNILRNKSGVINYLDDVRIFAACITKTNIDIEFELAKKIDCSRIKNAISHTEFIVDDIENNSDRPTIICRPVNEEMHNFYYGINRAKSSVIELCILASRLGIIKNSKIKEEIKYLKIAIEKTAGQDEMEAWNCVLEYINNYMKKIDKNA